MPKTAPSAKNRLKNLRALEVSCVKSGANRRKWAIIKSEEGAVPKQDTFLPATLSEQDIADVRTYVQMRNDAIEKADGEQPSVGEKEEAALQAVRRIVANFKDTLTIADLVAMGAQAGLDGAEEDGDMPDEDGEEDDSAGAMPSEPVTQTMEQPVKVDKDMNWQVPKPDGVSDDDHQEAMKAAKAAYLGKMGKAEKADDESEDDEDVEKACDDEESEVKKSAEPSEEQKAYFAEVKQALMTKCAELEGQVAAMRDEKVLKSYEDRLRSELPSLSIDHTATAKVLKSLDGNQQAHDAYWATLKAAHEQVAVAKSYGGSLYGSSRGQAGQFAGYAKEAETTGDRMDSMIQEQIKKSGNPDSYAAWQTLIKNKEFAALYEQNSVGEK